MQAMTVRTPSVEKRNRNTARRNRCVVRPELQGGIDCKRGIAWWVTGSPEQGKMRRPFVSDKYEM
jgi:hypothetical protein